jgi:hypothetical protein
MTALSFVLTAHHGAFFWAGPGLKHISNAYLADLPIWEQRRPAQRRRAGPPTANGFWTPGGRAHLTGPGAAGKPKMQAVGACMRKLVMLCYGVLKNRAPFDPHWASKKAS